MTLEANRYDAAMRRAIALSLESPAFNENPRVGAVLVDEFGAIVAEGFHRGVATPHAEIEALNAAREAGIETAGLTAVVTLEPCNHTGHTPPCAQALIDAGIKRVVFAETDPGKNEGGGRHTLEAAGVEVVGPVLAEEYRPVLLPWLINKFEQRPYVIVKYAASLDGRVAASDSTSKWITGEQARALVHAQRAAAQAILVGTNTVELDDPELTARKPDGELYESQPLRVVVGKRELPKNAKVFNRAVETLHLETHDLNLVMQILFERGIRQVYVEGGATLESALIAQGLADEFLIYLAPKLLGGDKQAIDDIGVGTISEAIELQIVSTESLGNDLFIRAIKKEN